MISDLIGKEKSHGVGYHRNNNIKILNGEQSRNSMFMGTLQQIFTVIDVSAEIQISCNRISKMRVQTSSILEWRGISITKVINTERDVILFTTFSFLNTTRFKPTDLIACMKIIFDN